MALRHSGFDHWGQFTKHSDRQALEFCHVDLPDRTSGKSYFIILMLASPSKPLRQFVTFQEWQKLIILLSTSPWKLLGGSYRVCFHALLSFHIWARRVGLRCHEPFSFSPQHVLPLPEALLLGFGMREFMGRFTPDKIGIHGKRKKKHRAKCGTFSA
jgi:hypothetical protein